MKELTWKTFLMNFIRCGVAGWCLEVMFTSVDSILAQDWRLMGTTSLLMFPIYGMGALLGPLTGWMDRWLGVKAAGSGSWKPALEAARLIRHGLMDMVLIFLMEYTAGTFLRRLGICPWDYTGWPDSVDGLIRLNFAPLWFGTGLLFEYLTQNRSRS